MQEQVLITYGVNIMNNDLLIKWVLFLSTYHHTWMVISWSGNKSIDYNFFYDKTRGGHTTSRINLFTHVIITSIHNYR